jgi:alpha-mannosidase
MEHTPEAQCPGHHEFDYALVPHTGDWTAEEALVLREAQAFNTPVTTRAVVTEQHPGVLPARAALVAVEPRELVVSAVKRSNNGQGLVVRIYNPLDHEVEANISLGIAFKQAYMANLLEEYQGPVDAVTGTRSINVGTHVRGGGIVTLVFT